MVFAVSSSSVLVCALLCLMINTCPFLNEKWSEIEKNVVRNTFESTENWSCNKRRIADSAV